jgi:polyisoprenoid-binding protein YceI
MKKLFNTTLLTLGIAAFGFSGSLEAKTHTVDTSKSVVKWTGKAATKSHWGHVNIKSADMKFEGEKPTSAKFVIDLNTIATKDIGPDKGSVNLDKHLKNADFFDVEKFPTATFESTKIENAGKNTFKVTGKLTIKGKTHEQVITVKHDGKKVTGDFTFDRSKFDVQYNSKSFFSVKELGDKLIHDDIKMEVTLALK